MRVFAIQGVMGATTRVACGDTAAALSAGILTSNNRSCKAVTLVVCPVANKSVRVAVGATPTQGASAVGVTLAPNDSMRLTGEHNIANLKHINADNGQNAVLQIMPEY